MLTLQELRPVGMMALQLPRALRPRRCGGVRFVTEPNAHYPVLLVHGYAATGSVWTPLRRALAEAGFGHIVSLTYNSFAADPVVVSAELSRQALRAIQTPRCGLAIVTALDVCELSAALAATA